MGHLTSGQRYTIDVMLRSGFKQNLIAKAIQKDKSVISREIKRNCDKRSEEYRHELATRKYGERKVKKPKKIKLTKEVKRYIESKLELRWSPEQISSTSSEFGDAMVSHERIYQYIIQDKKAGGTLYKYLRRKKKYRRRLSKDSRGKINNQKNIGLRPAVVDEKSRFGDLEIDLVIGKDHKGALLTANDRKSGYNWIEKLHNKESHTVAAALIKIFMPYKNIIHTITSDNGKEFADHEMVSKALNIDFYFADPYSSWQRGSNENFNGLVRDYLPKKTNFAEVTDEQVKNISEELNQRPRKRLDFVSPLKVFNLLTEKVAFKT